MNYYLDSKEDVLRHLESTQDGLSEQKAQERLQKYGKNKLAEGKKISTAQRFLKQLTDPMIIVLLAAAVISGLTAAFEHESFADVIIILIVVVLNAVLGVYQESKAEKAIEALQEMTAATSKVLRGGQLMTLRSEELTVGDVIILEAGDAVPADARILESASLKMEEAALTGESVPVDKLTRALRMEGSREVPLGDRKNMAYMGSAVAFGRGKAVVTAVGMETEMGKIAHTLAQTEENQTPLQIKLGQLSKILSYLVIGICVFIFAVSLLRAGSINREIVLSTFMVAVSLAVAAIPEGLATVVTIVLSIGVTNMSRRNAVIRKLTAVETLGCAQVVCSDKTGTLTQNKMTVTDYYGSDEIRLAHAMALCTDAQLQEGKAKGEPTECALVNYAYSLQLDKNTLQSEYPRIGEAPFESVRKMMSTVHHSPDGIVQYTKGAPDEVLRRCTKIWQDGQEQPLTDDMKKKIHAENKKMADRALRVLCAAQKNYIAPPESYEADALEKELTFLGLTGMIDPVRPEAAAAIVECRAAGIRPVMITGDHKDTAVAIASQLGILSDASEAVTGADVGEMSDAELEEKIAQYSVYARVQPEHKVRIVRAWRKNGKITAMTGDGVNDAPSIKSADIGVGMGITGTDVTKNVADMVLADDNFATIVTAVREGRRIYDNIRKAIQFLLASNLSEVLSIFAATLIGFVILKPVHLLWINLITDSLPALALGMEPAEKDVMQRRPRDPKEGVFAGGLGADVVYQGIMVTVITLAAYLLGHFIEAGEWRFTASPDGMTMAFLTMSMAEIFHSFNMRSQKGSIFKMKSRNVYLTGAMLLSLALTTAVIYVPFLANAFSFAHISLLEYAAALLLAFMVIPIVELVKLARRREVA